MSFLLGFAAVVLAVVLIVQIIRVFELTSKLSGNDQSKVSFKDNRTRAFSWLLFMTWYFALFVWVVMKWGPHVLPEAASVHGESIDFLLNVNWAIILIAFFITHIVLVTFVLKYYARPGSKATFISHNNTLEILWTTTPAIVLAVIIILGLKTWNEYNGDVAEDAINIELYAKQFDWTARYAGDDNQLGKANFNFINTQNALGLVTETTIKIRITELEEQIAELKDYLTTVPKDGLKETETLAAIHHKETQLSKIHAFRRNNQLAKNAAKDDKLVKVEFHVPVGRQINFSMRSQDVIHSAFMPHFRAQMNCVPGMVTRMRFIPTITTAEMRVKTGNKDFDYLLLCNKICGAAHYNMQMNVIVDTQEDYDKWIAEQATFNEKLMAALGLTETDNNLALNNQ
ncbi:MAG: cytochrome c oxidase subunit II [Salibacteraceae bacterium]